MVISSRKTAREEMSHYIMPNGEAREGEREGKEEGGRVVVFYGNCLFLHLVPCS